MDYYVIVSNVKQIMLPKLIPMLLIFFLSCNSSHPQQSFGKVASAEPAMPNVVNTFNKIIDIPLPAGYTRIAYPDNSFALWLRNIRLRRDKTVHLYNGQPKGNQTAQFAVLDVSVPNKDLQQCADAVMRLRAEYLYQQGNYANISFSDYNGKAYTFHSPFTRQNFDNYLQKIFELCGSASLSKQLRTHIEMKDIQPGDVLIRGGFPGHAVMVMDVAMNNKGEKIYLLAQSYMPAQDIHVLNDYYYSELSPWYPANNAINIYTPEYNFTRNELKRW